MAGYTVEGSSAFLELSAEEARAALGFFAADTMVMTHGSAPSARTLEIVAAGVARLGSRARFFSNGLWHARAITNPFTWTGISDATFDGGVIGMSPDIAFILWVEEED